MVIFAIRDIRTKEKELTMLKALPIEDFMNFQRIQRESLARYVCLLLSKITSILFI
jgi:hypothetical protein